MKVKAARTRERLLAAAGEVFAERGYREATIREIARRARANGAAVNYHFRDKEGLYAQVLGHFMRAAVERHPPHAGLPPGAVPEERLRGFVQALLGRLFENGPHARLMAREMVEPTRALDGVVRRVIGPMYERLLGIVRELAGGALSPEGVRRSALSIVAQCLFYKLCAAVLVRLGERVPASRRDIDRLADHVTAFSLDGLRTRRRRA